MLNLPDPSPNTHTLEPWVRAALTSGELTPAAEAQINYLAAIELSDGNRRLLALLHDAIAEGCVRRVQPSAYEMERQSDFSGGKSRAETEVF